MLVAALILGRAVAMKLARRQQTREAVDVRDSPDCIVSECGADGVPLSEYAG